MLKTIVVEGVGDATEKLYEPALRKLKAAKGKHLQVWFTDQSCRWRHHKDLREKRKRTIERFQSWGGKYLDKSYPEDTSEEKNWAEYQKLRDQEIDAVFIATPDRTHTEMIEYWLDSKCGKIFVEKPLDRSYASAMILQGKVALDDPRVRVFDHYRARVHNELRNETLLAVILRHLGGTIERFSFYCLEDHSGTDERYTEKLTQKGDKQRNGPIENEQRVEALKQGLILDLMPHMPALLLYFGIIGSIFPYRVRVGQYTGVDFNLAKPTEIPCETFAHVDFQFDSFWGRVFNGEAFVGKGIRGSKSFPEMDGNVKALMLVGSNGRKFLIDLRSSGQHSSTGRLIYRKKKPDTVLRFRSDPYDYLMSQVDDGDDYGVSLGLPVSAGVDILSVMDKMRFSLQGKKKADYPRYKLGMKDGTRCPYLEDLMEGRVALPLTYGS